MEPCTTPVRDTALEPFPTLIVETALLRQFMVKSLRPSSTSLPCSYLLLPDDGPHTTTHGVDHAASLAPNPGETAAVQGDRPLSQLRNLLLPTTPVLDPPASVRRERFGRERSGHDTSGLPYTDGDVKGGKPIDE